MTKTLTVHLADAPRDVLVHLADHPDRTLTSTQIAEAVAPPDADTPIAATVRACALLRDMGCVSHEVEEPSGWKVTADGIALVKQARAERMVDPASIDDPAAQWDHLLCPLPDCVGELYLDLHETVPIYRNSTAADMVNGNGVTRGWEVVCTEGHTLLRPLDDHAEDADFTDRCEGCTEISGDDYHNDIARLRALLDLAGDKPRWKRP